MSNDKTQWIFDENGPEQSKGGEMTESLEGGPMRGGTFVGSDEETELVGGPIGAGAEKTTIYHAGDGAEGLAEDVDPVTGWLVVVKGPGVGRSVALGAGMNAVGRGAEARVSLPFGDRQISSEDHVRIIYDDAGRSFFIAHGSGTNVSRVNGQLLATTLPLEPDATIQLSKATTVVFKPFCSPDFDWTDVFGDGTDQD